MSATDELQQMLDERGADYAWTDLRRSIPSREIVQWWPDDDVRAEYIEYYDGSTVLHIHTSMLHATPEQAIAAVLGSSNCTNSERMTEHDGPERSGEYVTVWMDHKPTKLHWGIPVVRCRDCEYYRDHEWMLVTDVSDVCHHFADGVKVEPDGFCAWGRPKEEQ